MHASRGTSTRRGGFTLIELLVVIGIIGVLLAILLPALSAARQHALTIKCASNLHQIYVGTLLYTQDNRGHLPVPPYYHLDVGFSHVYDTMLLYTMTGLGQVNFGRGTMRPYIPHPEEIFLCPSDTALNMSWGDTAGDHSVGTSLLPYDRNFSFSFNEQLRDGHYRNFLASEMFLIGIRNPDVAGIMITDIIHPDQKVLIFETEYASEGVQTWRGVAWGHDAIGMMTKRHGKKGNQCFADGHVICMSPLDYDWVAGGQNRLPMEVVRPAVDLFW